MRHRFISDKTKEEEHDVEMRFDGDLPALYCKTHSTWIVRLEEGGTFIFGNSCVQAAGQFIKYDK